MAHMGDITVGIPRALAYYLYYPVWKSFFEGLGVRVVTSVETTEKILNDGVRYTVTDACVPIKVFHGHVVAIKDKVDYLFIPRLVNVSKDIVFCPKFLGLSDMVKSSIEDLPPIIDVRIDLRKGKMELWRVCYRVGRIFTKNWLRILSAYRSALQTFRKFNILLQEGRTTTCAIDILEGREAPDEQKSYDLTVGLVGYPYEIYDRFVSSDVMEKLRDLNVRVVTVDMLPASVFVSTPKIITKELFWFFSDRAIKGGVHFLNDKQIDGVIHITAFSCGPDFMVNKLLELEAKRLGHTPFMTLMIDEQTGDAGVRTRVEAFVDMIRRRKSVTEKRTEVSVDGEVDLSLYGDISHSC
jgi:predicted nucleotide-binding protein (sugar kinase/HSP70/actin superfamily)